MTEAQNNTAQDVEKEVLPELSTQQLLEEVSKGHRALKVYEKGVQVLQGLVVLEQNIKEKTSSLEKLKATENEWLSKRQKAHSEADAAVQRGNDATDAAAAEAKRTIEEARGTAQRITTEAKIQSNKMIAEAKSEAAVYLEKADSSKAETAKTDAALVAKKKELSDVTATIAQHKEAMKKFVG